MEPKNLFPWILLTISLVADGCFAVNVYLMALLTRYKACLVETGFHRHPSMEYHDTFSSIVKPRFYASFSVLRQAEAGCFVGLMSIMHFWTTILFFIITFNLCFMHSLMLIGQATKMIFYLYLCIHCLSWSQSHFLEL